MRFSTVMPFFRFFVLINLILINESPFAQASLCLKFLELFSKKAEKPAGYILKDKTFRQITIVPSLLPEPTRDPDAQEYWEYGSVSLKTVIANQAFEEEFVLTGREYGWKGEYLADSLLGKTLDLGCGPQGLEVRGLRRHGREAYGVDVVITNQDVPFLLQASATDLPFPDNFFDNVISNYSIFFYTKDPSLLSPAQEAYFFQAVKETVRVLAIGGSIRTHVTKATREWILHQFPNIEYSEGVAGGVQLKKTGNFIVRP